MKIGVIGGGRVGSGLAAFWEKARHDVRVSTRDTVADTAAFADVVVLAVPASIVPEVLSTAGAALEGKMVVDATNNLRGGPGAEEIATLVPGARVVKAFNTVFAALYDQIAAAAERPDLVYCGDDESAKETVAALIRDAGFEPVDAGPLASAGDVEAFARLVIGIAYEQGRGPFVYRFASQP
jgi:predicted dinucleotide-binding enzyme